MRTVNEQANFERGYNEFCDGEGFHEEEHPSWILGWLTAEADQNAADQASLQD